MASLTDADFEMSGMGPFQVDKELVKSIGDELLRELLVRLLEAESRERGIDPAGIRAGGNQTAADGGVDVWLAWTGGLAPRGWLPARSIAFQCKAETMRRADIVGEMRPGGQPRPLFKRLARQGGAYVIFSTDDPSDLGQRARDEAMRGGLDGVPDADRIVLRFFGADTIARWTNQHLGVGLWLLQKCGRGLAGWQQYGDWSAAGSSTQQYIRDDSDRVDVGGVPSTSEEAIELIRGRLRSPGGAARLIGISGMGKTRFAEALFDACVGKQPLPAETAIYADAGFAIGVSVPVLAEQLTGAGVRAVIVADNCPIGVHNQVSRIVARAGGRVSLLSIDHDLGGDCPENTLIAKMEGNSVGALVGLLAQRCAWLGQADIGFLAEFSGGNARVALKIADGSRDGVNLASLNDTEMLDRLFQTDRHDLSEHSRAVAHAAALVYAFQVDPADHVLIEHPVLAAIIAVDADLFYREVGRLIDFGIAQRRGPQRAVMPPPIANMLAIEFIRRSNPSSLISAFKAGPRRLFKSFARRLGYLHAVTEAVALVVRMFEDDGILGDPASLQTELKSAFLYAAPAAPQDALVAVARSLRGGGGARLLDPDETDRQQFGRLLVQIAHDPELFVGAMETLLLFMKAERPDNARHSLSDHFFQRFWPMGSATLADQGARLAFIDRLLDDDDETVRRLGVKALDSMLDIYFSSSVDIGFGARTLTGEWRPRGEAGYEDWCRSAYERLTRCVETGGRTGELAREVVATSFRQQLSAEGGSIPVVAMRAVRGMGYWDDGWNAVSEALHFRRAGFKADLLPGVQALERELRPRKLEELFEAFVVGEPWRHWHPSGREKQPVRKLPPLARRIGRCVIRKDDPAPYLDRAFRARGQTSVYDFAVGLGASASDPDALWRQARTKFSGLKSADRNAGVLSGLLSGFAKRNRTWVEDQLDAAAGDPLLRSSIVTLHIGLTLNDDTMRRFSAALRSGDVPANQFTALMYGGVSKTIPAASLAEFLGKLYEAEDGVLPALQVLHMRFFGDVGDKRPIAKELIETARAFVTNARSYREENASHDHGLTETAGIALGGGDAADVARGVCRALRDTSLSNRGGAQHFDQLCAMLIKRFPEVVLDEIVGADVAEHIVNSFFGGIFKNDDDTETMNIPDRETALAWVARDPQARALRLAGMIRYAVRNEDGPNLAWSPLALALIKAAPDAVAVLNTFEERFWSGGGSGSFASRLVRRRPLIAAMVAHSDRRVRNWAREAGARLEADITRWDGRDIWDNPRFE